MQKIQDSSASATRATPVASGTIGWFQHANLLLSQVATKVTVDWLNDLQGSFIDLFTRTSITPTAGSAGDRNLYDAVLAVASGTSVQATNGYQVLPSGLIIQWG